MASEATLRPRATRRWAPSGLLFWPILLMVTLMFLLPLFWVVTTSFKPLPEILSRPPTLLPVEPTLENYQQVATSPAFRQFFLNSFIAAMGSTAIALVVGIPAALGFARFRYRFSNWLLGASILVRMFPPVALALPYFLQFRALNLLDNPWGLILAYVPIALPLVLWILEGFFRDFPDEVLEAARVDGAGVPSAIVRVVLPMSKPAIGVAVLFGFLVTWNEFVIALSVTRTPSGQTMPVGIATFITQFQTHWGGMTAAAALYLLPALVLTAFAQRGIVEGLTAGATKG